MKAVFLFIIVGFCYGGWGATGLCEVAYTKKKPSFFLNLMVTNDFGKRKDLSNMDFRARNLSYNHLQEAKLINSDFTKANLNNAVLSSVDATNANFTEADLHQVHLTNAVLDGAIFTGAKLNGAKLENVDLTKVIGLETADLAHYERGLWDKFHPMRWGPDPYTDTILDGAKVTKQQAEYLTAQGLSGFVVVE